MHYNLWDDLVWVIDPNSIFMVITNALFFVLTAEMEFWDTGGMNRTFRVIGY